MLPVLLLVLPFVFWMLVMLPGGAVVPLMSLPPSVTLVPFIFWCAIVEQGGTGGGIKVLISCRLDG